MSKLKLIVACLVVAGVSSVLTLEFAANDRLRRENESLRLAIAELKQSQQVRDPIAADDSVAKDQLAELLKLRGEMTQLRQQTNEVASLREENEKLQAASLKLARPIRVEHFGKKSPEDALPQDIHPKDTWAFRGYGTPEATVESVCWAMANGDKATFLGGFSPEMLAQVEKGSEGKDLMEDIKKVNNAEFRILDRRQLSDDEMALTVYTTRDGPNGNNVGSSENTVFQRINGEWKVTDKHLPDN